MQRNQANQNLFDGNNKEIPTVGAIAMFYGEKSRRIGNRWSHSEISENKPLTS
jgi:hypothetical protein